ncbi:MAG: MBL fold metallo-hydrolase [Lentimicrobiaceae bacterium]|nr:MBL fold metallo-hydrolase [Lentimicrobiaceae bacterium]
MKITVLGSGTSQGVPIIACNCDVCTSTDPKDKRLRTSILIETENTVISIDAGPDFRQQMLRAGVKRLDAILITHEHKDHIAGLDDVRPFVFLQQSPMKVYASSDAQEEIKREFSYAFAKHDERYPGAPSFDIIDINGDQIIIKDLIIEPIKLKHFTLNSYAFKIDNFSYVTDLSELSEEAFNKLKGTEYLIIEALRHEPHYSHICLSEAIDIAQRLGVKKAWFTHIGHSMGKAADINPTLPENMMLAYDGMEIII